MFADLCAYKPSWIHHQCDGAHTVWGLSPSPSLSASHFAACRNSEFHCFNSPLSLPASLPCSRRATTSMDGLSFSWGHGTPLQLILGFQNVSVSELTTNINSSWSASASEVLALTPLTVLGIYIPALVGSLTLLYDLLSRIPYPRSIRSAYGTLTAPFRNFLTLHDFEDIGDSIPQPVWKRRMLATLSLLQSFTWLSVLIFA